jgi:glutamate-1-semialdehyde aminotransferase
LTTVDITTTSVGRDTVRLAYRSFFENVKFSGDFRVVVTIDPAYGVSDEEFSSTVEYLRSLPRLYGQVRSVVVEQLPRQTGLQGALSILMAHARSDVGVHLEDDWEITGPVDLDAIAEELYLQDSTEIVLSNSHVARGGTLDRPGEAEPVPGATIGLLRLTGTSWAAHYMPLCPHVHQTARWAPTMAKVLALTDPVRCPDERVREYLMTGAEQHNVLWTRDVLARDTGRDWLAERGRFKAITPAHVGVLGNWRVVREPDPLPLERSRAARERAERVIPGMTQTFLKRPENFAEGEYPVYLDRGEGSVVWDVDGTGYVDFVLALGAASLGHAHPLVTNVIRERVDRGVLLSLPARAEIEAAEELVAAVPGVEKVRFLKTGAEACSAAVRLARAHTGRTRILLAGYHGWHDQLGGPSAGVPPEVSALGERRTLNGPEDDELLVETVRSEGTDLAAVVVSTPYQRILSTEFLRELRTVCDTTGCLVVLDEIVTGFRLAPGGLGQLAGVRADILCFSKGMAAGMPLAAVAGPAETMDGFGRLRVSTTFGGELLSLEVMKVALRTYAKTGYYEHIDRLGSQLRHGINSLGWGEVVAGYGPMPCLTLESDTARRFVAGMARRGFLMRRDVNFIAAVHTTEQVGDAVAAAAEVLKDVM